MLEARAARLDALTIKDFRNITHAELVLPPEGIALVGENDQGKTNCVEAIAYLRLLRSLRGARDRGLIRFGAPAFNLTARLGGLDALGVSVGVDKSGRKKVLLDGAEGIAVGAYTLLRPSLGEATELRWSGHRHTAVAMLTGFVIGVYDGALGPGTGSFFVLTLVGLMGYSFLEASAKAKIANLATNLGALTVFAPGGHVIWRVAVVMAVANVAGGYVGARTAVSRGNRFVRVVFIVVVGAFIVRIGGDLLGIW